MADAAKVGASQARRLVVAAGAIESSGGVVVESSSIVSGRANESDEAGVKTTLSPPAGRVRIFVTGLGGDATPIECDLPADTIATLKRQMQGVHDVEPARQRLVLNGAELRSGPLRAVPGLCADARVHLLVISKQEAQADEAARAAAREAVFRAGGSALRIPVDKGSDTPDIFSTARVSQLPEAFAETLPVSREELTKSLERFNAIIIRSNFSKPMWYGCCCVGWLGGLGCIAFLGSLVFARRRVATAIKAQNGEWTERDITARFELEAVACCPGMDTLEGSTLIFRYSSSGGSPQIGLGSPEKIHRHTDS